MSHVFLVPGFFGFTNLGDLPYFSHFHVVLSEELNKLGVDATVTPLDTLPTHSIRLRARRLLEHIEAHTDQSERVHIIGHSSGGLDARFLVATDVELPGRERVLERVSSIVSIATPHRGTPVAGFFTSLLGQRLLKLLSLTTVAAIRLGSVPLPALVFLTGAVAQTGALSWAGGGMLDQIYHLVLADFSTERRKEIEEFLESSYQDQTLLGQLTPEAMELVDALAHPAPNIRYGSVVAAAPPPDLKSQLKLGANPRWQATYGIYRGLHLLCSRTPEHLVPSVTEEQRSTVERGVGWRVDATDNDGMVPVLSQVWGDVIHAARADHLDVMGHFHGPRQQSKHVDWLRTGSNFGTRDFHALAQAVARFIAEDDKS